MELFGICRRKQIENTSQLFLREKVKIELNKSEEQIKKLISKAIFLAIIIFCIRCAISWNDIVSNFSLYDMWGFTGEAIGLTTVLMMIYEKWLWKLNRFEDTPVLKKEYLGIIKSNFNGVEREAKLEIKQTLLFVHITLISGESRSKSISSSIDNILGENQLTYCYLNTPKVEFRERSEIHYGTAMLCIINSNKLVGHYYTDRNTRGDMDFNAK